MNKNLFSRDPFKLNYFQFSFKLGNVCISCIDYTSNYMYNKHDMD